MPSQPSIENLANITLNCVKGPLVRTTFCVHNYLCRHGLAVHRLLGNHLVLMLAESGKTCDAQNFFDRLHYRNECSWNGLIRALIQWGKPQHALSLYKEMEESSSELNVYTLVALLKACAALKDFKGGCAIHTHIARMGLLEGDLFVGNTLIDMYAKCGWLVNAQEVFDKL
eukprot:c17787_g2_i1 orf=1-510(-)